MTFLGPRFKPQDMCRLERDGLSAKETVIARVQVPPAVGKYGWVAK